MKHETFEVDHEVVDGETALGRGIVIGLLVTVWAIAGVCAVYGFATGALWF